MGNSSMTLAERPRLPLRHGLLPLLAVGACARPGGGRERALRGPELSAALLPKRP
ncbi:hypothetical protein [Streptomyces angustmyceticus]|uniref:hypothetical protein n=1 Tax=Streptomyces angustmyceticus TaxID=285578 RepID=UPI003D909BBE